MIEGIYAQNGDGFDGGPGPSGLPDVFMTNLLVFGKDAFRVDIVGHWLGGHEPGNFGLFHLAKERGVSTALDPKNIPVYAWEDDGPRLTPLDRFERVPLATPYLEKPGEARFHLCNEPFAYPAEAKAACLSRRRPAEPARARRGPVAAGPDVARRRVRAARRRARLPRGLRLAGASGSALLAQGRLPRGVHASAWRPGPAAGTYWWRLRAEGSTCFGRPRSGLNSRRA